MKQQISAVLSVIRHGLAAGSWARFGASRYWLTAPPAVQHSVPPVLPAVGNLGNFKLSHCLSAPEVSTRMALNPASIRSWSLHALVFHVITKRDAQSWVTQLPYGSCYIWTFKIPLKFSDFLPLSSLYVGFQLGWNSWKNRSPAMEWKSNLGDHLGSVQKLFCWEWKAREVKLYLRGQCNGALGKSLHFFRANRNRAESKALKSVERVPLIPVVYEPGRCGFGWRNVSFHSAV